MALLGNDGTKHIWYKTMARKTNIQKFSITYIEKRFFFFICKSYDYYIDNTYSNLITFCGLKYSHIIELWITYRV